MAILAASALRSVPAARLGVIVRAYLGAQLGWMFLLKSLNDFM